MQNPSRAYLDLLYLSSGTLGVLALELGIPDAAKYSTLDALHARMLVLAARVDQPDTWSWMDLYNRVKGELRA